MINLSYLSKLQIIGYAFFTIYLIGYLVKLYLNGFNAVDTLLLVLYIVLGIVFNIYFFALKTSLNKSIEVLNSAVKGDLESRIVSISDN